MGVSWKPVLKINVSYAFSLIYYHENADPFDCTEDPCHLAWVIQDNRYLLNKLVVNFGGTILSPRCANGTLFQDLDRTRFSNCEFEGILMVLCNAYRFLQFMFFFKFTLFTL